MSDPGALAPDSLAPGPLAIVGGGPAGMAAAIEAARAGVRCTIVDEAPALGGQIYRAPPAAFGGAALARGRDARRGRALRDELGRFAARVEIRVGTDALGVWPRPGGFDLLCARADASEILRAQALVLATGAYDRPVPFPGWTLPGVMTAGGVQAMIKTMRVVPGRRALVAGTGPLLLVVAAQLAEAGVQVNAVIEAGRRPPPIAALRALWGHWRLLGDAIGYLAALRRHGVPVLYHHAVRRAAGAGRVESVEAGPVDPADWRPLPGAATTFEVDLLAVGYGFVPATELSALAGCEHRYHAELGGWVPVRDASMETSVPGVFAAGDGAGVAGALVAEAEGRVAGIAAAERLGALSPAEASARKAAPLRRLRALARPRRFLDDLSRIRPGLATLAGPDTLLCRCEEVCRARLDDALAAGARDLQAVKLFTRLGMGPCQGRNCAPGAALYLAGRLGRAPGDLGRIRPRPPVKPVTLGALAGTAGPEVRPS